MIWAPNLSLEARAGAIRIANFRVLVCETVQPVVHAGRWSVVGRWRARGLVSRSPKAPVTCEPDAAGLTELHLIASISFAFLHGSQGNQSSFPGRNRGVVDAQRETIAIGKNA